MSIGKLAPLDDWIRQLYVRTGITAPYGLNLYRIAAACRIWVHHAPVRSQALERNGIATIILDDRLDSRRQWEEFGHELCHILRQSGNQLLMPDTYLHYQEWKAERFALRFCVPSFMLHETELPVERHRAIDTISDTFNVTRCFAARRLEEHEQHLLRHSLDQRFRAAAEAAAQYSASNGVQYCTADSATTMIYCRERGVIGYIGGTLYEP